MLDVMNNHGRMPNMRNIAIGAACSLETAQTNGIVDHREITNELGLVPLLSRLVLPRSFLIFRKCEQPSWEVEAECGGFSSMASGISGASNQCAFGVRWSIVYECRDAMGDVHAA